jgi:hypothetical protein
MTALPQFCTELGKAPPNLSQNERCESHFETRNYFGHPPFCIPLESQWSQAQSSS